MLQCGVERLGKAFRSERCPERRKDARFDLFALDVRSVPAGSLDVLSAAVRLFRPHDETPPTAAAFEQPAQEVFLTPCTLRIIASGDFASGFRGARLYCFPEIIRDDPERRDLDFFNPIGRRFDDARFCLGMDPLRRTKHQHAPGVDRVVQNSLLAREVAADRPGFPGAAARRGDTLGIQPPRDRERGLPVGERLKNPTHYRSLHGIDLSVMAASTL
nr:hypothetical protein [Thioclava sp. NG1]